MVSVTDRRDSFGERERESEGGGVNLPHERELGHTRIPSIQSREVTLQNRTSNVTILVCC